MILQETMSYKQLYQLFGYKRKVKLWNVFPSLLYSITPIDEDEDNMVSPMYFVDGISLSYATMIRMFPNFSKAKDNLSQYLYVKYSKDDMRKIDFSLQIIELNTKKLSSISKLRFYKRWVLKREIRELSKSSVDIRDVFAYLKYSAERAGISQQKLEEYFKNYAETFPDGAI